MQVTAVLLCLFVTLALGMPVGFSMGLSGIFGLFMLGGLNTVMGILDTTALSSVSSYELITIPMFLLMAELVLVSGVAKELFRAAAAWVGRIPGGLGIATALTGAGFAAICGSSTAAAATLSSTSLPAMLEQGYEPRMAAGVVAVSGTLAILIPPSVGLVLYGIIADVSIGKLLVGGVIPGLLVTLTIILTVLFLVWQDPSRAPTSPTVSWREKIALLQVVAPMLLLFGMVTGVIYTGVATPTEASALGATGAFFIAVVKRASVPDMYQAFLRATLSTCMILTIILGASIFGYYFTLSKVTQDLTHWVVALGVAPWVIIAFFLISHIIMGAFMDQIAIMVLTIPVALPIIIPLGYDPIWFGVLFVVAAEVGLITPPVGLNCYVVARYSKMPVEQIFHGVVPHWIAHIIIIFIFTVFPGIILWLPSRM
jgi:tripartite ATP-independent transporter DctM subunit